MPSKSPAQAKLMRAVSHGWKKPGGGGPSPSVAREFVDADQKYQIGGRAVMDEGFGRRGLIGRIGLLDAVPQGGQIPYARPRAPEGEITPEMMDPRSIAANIYEKYGIVDPTATRYDLTSQDALQEDPLAHLELDDPARIEYEGWNQQRADEEARQDNLRGLGVYATNPSEARTSSPHRKRLKEHQNRIGDILGVPSGNSARGGPVNLALGGLLSVMHNDEERGKLERRKGYGMRPVLPQYDQGGDEQLMREGMKPPGFQVGGLARARMGRGRPSPQRLGMMRAQRMNQRRPSPQQGTPGRGGEPSLSPSDARMPGGRAMPFRGLQQKLQAQRRGTGQGNRIGMRDQQGGLARAMQTQTGRPPISRRAAFPGSRTNQY